MRRPLFFTSSEMTVFPGWKHNRFGLAGNLDRPSAPGTAALEIASHFRISRGCSIGATARGRSVEEISSSGAGELLTLYLSLESRESLSEVILWRLRIHSFSTYRPRAAPAIAPSRAPIATESFPHRKYIPP